MKIDVDAPKCVASGQCVLIAPNVFDQDDDGIVIVLNDAPAPAEQDAVREAATICPAAVISVVDA